MKSFMTEIVGNNTLTSMLGQDILNNILPHAIILEGPAGTGKHTIAKMISASLACTEKQNGTLPLPCLECIECRKVLENKSPDIITISREDRATLGVDAIRFIKEDIHIIPNDLDFKVYIIEDADKMTPQAQNALLLSLEEPPAFVKFILLCESSDKLLETIKSRAPRYRTMPIDNDTLEQYICKNDIRAAQMRRSARKDFDELIVASEHGIGTAKKYLDAKAFAPIKAQRAIAYDFLRCAIYGDSYGDAFSLISRFSSKRDILSCELTTILSAIRDLMVLKKTENAPLVFFSDKESAIELCDRTTLSRLFLMSNAVNDAIEENSRNANVRLMITKMATSVGII